MKKFNNYLLGIVSGLLILILIEGVITFGTAFQFEKYNLFAWIVQILLVIFTISLSIKVTDNECN
jgi:hypothetical protein